MAFFVYILECSDGSYYTGHTEDLEVRLSEHKHKKHYGYTARRMPYKLIYQAAFGSRIEAIAAEQKIKGWTREKKEALMRGDWDKLIELSNLKKSKEE